MKAYEEIELRKVLSIDRQIIEPNEIQTGTLYVGLESIISGGTLNNVREVNASELESSKFRFDSRHVLFGKLRPYLAKVARPTFSGICSTDILPLLPSNTLDRNYLSHFLLLPHTVKLANSLASGANLPRISPDSLASIKIPLPTLAEQKRISATLDKADALRAKRREALGKLESLTQSIFLEMFGDPVTNPKGWELRQLQEVVKEDTVVTYGIVQAGDEFPGGVPYIRTGDIVEGEIVVDGLRHTEPKIAARFSRSRVETGDIVMSIRATVGTTASVHSELHGANLTQGTARIAPGPFVERHYLLSYLRTAGTQHWISRQIKGATFREITLARLREMPVLVPPIKLQEEFARRVEAMDKLKTAHRASLTGMNALFSSLQHRAFRGAL